MPLHRVTPESEKIGWRRLQVMGDPATLKTTVMAQTCDKPACLVGLPGEKHTDIFVSTPDLEVIVFDPPDYSDPKIDWVKNWREVRTETFNLTREKKYGKFESVIFDGAHKAFYTCCRAGMQKFSANIPEKPEAWNGLQGWPWINNEFLEWFSIAYYSDVPWVFWNMWSSKEQTDQTAAENSKEAKKRSIWPDYMGKFQRTCMGETNIVYQYLEGGKPYWHLRQTETIQGVGIRVPPERAATLPVRIEANWQKLKAILQPQGQEVKV